MTERQKDMQIAELMESNRRLVERVHVLEEIQKAYRSDSGSTREEVEDGEEVECRNRLMCVHFDRSYSNEMQRLSGYSSD